MVDLIEQLERTNVGRDYLTSNLFVAAANEIASLRSTIDRLRGERKQMEEVLLQERSGRNTYRAELAEAKAALEAANARAGKCGMEGHHEPCYYCGEQCNSLVGKPSRWPVALCHSDEPGVVKWHHTGCVMERLARAERAEAHYSDAVKDLQEWRGVAQRAEAEAKALRALLRPALDFICLHGDREDERDQDLANRIGAALAASPAGREG